MYKPVGYVLMSRIIFSPSGDRGWGRGGGGVKLPYKRTEMLVVFIRGLEKRCFLVGWSASEGPER